MNDIAVALRHTPVRRAASKKGARRAFVGLSAILFAISVAATICCCAPMSAGQVPICGGAGSAAQTPIS